jgi:hypothetical protein
MVHVVVMMVVMVVMMMMMVMMVHRRFGSHRRRPGRGASGCFLCDGVAGEPEREHGGNGEGLDHRKVFLW